MKICHFITGLNTGGAEMMLHRLVTVSLSSGTGHVVVSLSGHGTLGARLEAAGARVYNLEMRSGLRGLFWPIRLFRIILAEKPDCLQGWMPHGNLVATVAKLFVRPRARLFWNVRQSLYDLSRESRATQHLIRVLARLSFLPERIIYNSEVGASHHERLGYRQDRTLLVPNGFDVTVWSPGFGSRKDLLQELSLEESTILVGLVGRYDPLKDHPTFLRGFASVAESEARLHAVLVGRGVDASNVILMDLVSQLGLGDRVSMLGERGDVAAVTSCLDIACSSSISEGFSNAVGEAMSCGVPCLVTDVGESAAIVGTTGVVVPPDDADAFADGLRSLLRLGPQGLRERGRLARQRVIENFSIAAVAKRYEDVYSGNQDAKQRRS